MKTREDPKDTGMVQVMQRTCEFVTKCSEINCMCPMRLDCKEGVSMGKQIPGRRLRKTSEMMVTGIRLVADSTDSTGKILALIKVK